MSSSRLIGVRLNPQPVPEIGHTVIVTGDAPDAVARAANVLVGLGIDMGGQLLWPSFSDPETARAIDAPIAGAWRAYARRRDDERRVWGFARPHLAPILSNLLGALRHPRLIVLTADPSAGLKDGVVTANALVEAGKAWTEQVKALNKVKCPTLVAPASAPAAAPEAFIDTLADFVGVALTEALRVAVRPRLALAPNGVRSRGRDASEARGGIDRLRPEGVLTGWARPDADAEPTAVRVWMDDVELGVFPARERREDSDRDAPDARWGFNAPLPPGWSQARWLHVCFADTDAPLGSVFLPRYRVIAGAPTD
ncbi:MAG: hypothetical protein ACFB2Z_12855 [Maricaulaceae bacterium]